MPNGRQRRRNSGTDERPESAADQGHRRLRDARPDRDPPTAASFVIPDDVPWVDEPEPDTRIGTHHVHRPSLEEAGLVEGHREGRRFATGPTSDGARPLLERLAEAEADPAGGSDGS